MRNIGTVGKALNVDRNPNPKTTADMIREPQYAPIKGRIRQMEDEQAKLDVLKQSKNEDNLKKVSYRNEKSEQEITVVSTDGERKPSPLSPIPSESLDSNKFGQENRDDSNKLASVVAPTPLPRTSRNNSMTDPSSSEESSSTGSPRPSPMPRVTIGSAYKVQ